MKKIFFPLIFSNTNIDHMKKNAYLSVDIEADGPSPYKNSMLSFGVTLLTKDKKILSKWEWNLRPLEGHEADPKTMKEFWQKNAEIRIADERCTDESYCKK